MPETSDSMPLIAVYLTLVMVMTSVSVLTTVVVLNFHHRGKDSDSLNLCCFLSRSRPDVALRSSLFPRLSSKFAQC